MAWRMNEKTVLLFLVIVCGLGVTSSEGVSSVIKVLSSESVSNWSEIVSATTEGGVHNDVERSLREVLNFSRDDIYAIRSSTSIKTIYYCQSAFNSTGSWRSGWQCESARPARLPGFFHHHFVVHLRGTNSEGELLKLSTRKLHISESVSNWWEIVSAGFFHHHFVVHLRGTNSEGELLKLFTRKLHISESVSNWWEIVSATTEGGVHNDVERSLREVLNFSRDDIDAIRSSTSVKTIYYCQSAFASTGSWRSGSQCESARPARLQGFFHHHFAVVHLRATNSEGELLELFISAEKERTGQGGGTSGIYINLMTECELQMLEDNTLLTWDVFSIQVPLDVLITKLFEGHDTGYNLVNKNCWDYAKGACRSVFLLLSQQPGATPKQKQILLEKADKVSLLVNRKATWDAFKIYAMLFGIYYFIVMIIYFVCICICICIALDID